MEVDIKYLIKYFAAIVVATLLSACVMTFQYCKYSGFVEVEAKIIDCYTKRGHFPNTLSALHLITYEYRLDGKTYSSTRQMFTKTGRETGKSEIIRYNPNKPEDIENTYLKKATACITIYLAVYSAILARGILHKRAGQD